MNEAAKPAKTNVEDDLALVGMVLGGDRRAFEPLVRRHERRVFRVVMAVLGNPQDAEEAMQDAFVKAFRHLDQFRQESKFTTWLTRIAVNEALQKRQKRKDTISIDEIPGGENKVTPRRFEPWATDPEKLYGKQELRKIVEGAIQALPPIYRETLVLRDIEGLTSEEAAEALGINVRALKSRLLRARLMLRESLNAAFEAPRPIGTKLIHGAIRLRNMAMMVLTQRSGR